MAFNMLTVSPGVELAYSDSGPPNVSPYTTIFAIHGICFTNLIFKKLQSAAFAKGYRFVAINRRPFAGSTPFSPEEIKLIVSPDTSTDKRAAFVEARGHELASFIDTFSLKFTLPPICNDGKTGGSIVFGWSMGSQFATATLAYIPTLPPTVRSRLVSQLRSLVVYDPSPRILGLPTMGKNWAPSMDTAVPEHIRLALFGQWVSGYFNNGDYSKHDHNTLEYVLPSTDKIPSIFKDDMNSAAYYGQEASFDLPLLYFFGEPFKKSFLEAFRGSEVAALFPQLKITFICADSSPPFAIEGLWAAQHALREAGISKNINYKIIEGANHFLHWDDPQKAFEVITTDA